MDRSNDGKLFFKVMAPAVYSRSFYSTRKKWLDDYAKLFGTKVTREWMDAFAELCRNFLTLDVTDRLSGIRVPTLMISAAEDRLKPPAMDIFSTIWSRIPSGVRACR